MPNPNLPAVIDPSVTKHPVQLLRKDKNVTEDAAINQIAEYLQKLSDLPCCYDAQDREKPNCSCFHAIDNRWLPCIARWMYDHHLVQDPVVKMGQRVDLVRAVVSADRIPVPSLGTPDGLNSLSLKICRHSLCRILDIKKDAYSSALRQAKKNKLEPHGHVGFEGNRRLKPEVESRLEMLFDELIKWHASPRATRFVRMETGMETRDDTVDLLELSPSWTVRGVYARFVAECGYKLEYRNAKGTYERPNSFPLDDFPEDLRVDPCALSTFQKYWKTHHSNLVIPNAREDMCNECYVLANDFRSFAHKALKKAQRIASAGKDPDDDEDGDDTDDIRDTQRFKDQQDRLEKAKLHCDRAKAQRQYTNEVAENIDDDSDVIVCDYMQNTDLPHYGSEQPNDVYYLSPLTINLFGVYCYKKKHLDGFYYTEGEGAKGGNNVASMIWEWLRKYGKVDRDGEGKPIRRRKSLTIVMDNCPGQNKVHYYIISAVQC